MMMELDAGIIAAALGFIAAIAAFVIYYRRTR